MFLSLLVVLAMSPADDSSADRVAAIKKEYADAEAAYRKEATALEDTKEGRAKQEEIYKAYDAKQMKLFDAALGIAKAEPKSDAAFAALDWMLCIPRSYYVPAGKPAIDLLVEHYSTDPRIGKAVAFIGYFNRSDQAASYDSTTRLLNTVATKNPDKTTRGQAVVCLAWRAKWQFDRAEAAGNKDSERLALEAEKQFEVVAKDYGDCKRLTRENSGTLGDVAKMELHELRNLRQGKTAPEIVGKDLDGAEFKLSDHKGKVVLLVFWASWCGPCMADVPHEKELVEKFKDRPFVLVGVNGDDKAAAAKKAIDKAKITWRSFWNGEKGPQGGIAEAWNVRGWPTVYVIDHTGVIRHKYLRGEKLDQPLEHLVAAAEKTTTK